MPYDPSAFIHFAMQNGVFPEGGKYGDRITFTIHAPNNLMLVLDAGRNTGVLPPSLEFDKRNGKITKVCNGFDKYPEMLKWIITCYVSQRVTRMTGLKVIKMTQLVDYDAATQEFDKMGRGVRSGIRDWFTRLGQDMLAVPVMEALALTERAMILLSKLTEEQADVLYEETETVRRKSQLGLIEYMSEQEILVELLDQIEKEVQ
jgi:hypothetical protein